MPTNRLLAAIRTRRGFKWGVPAMALGVVYFLLAAVLVVVIRDGGPGWLNVGVIWACWNGFKFMWIGPVSVVALARAKFTETRIG
jgi:hypothetical protein